MYRGAPLPMSLRYHVALPDRRRFTATVLACVDEVSRLMMAYSRAAPGWAEVESVERSRYQ